VQDNFTIFCVFRSTQGLGSGTLFYQGAGLVNGEVGGVVNDFGTCLFANGQICAGTGNPDVAVNSSASFNDGNPHLMTFKRVKSTGEVDLYVDGIFIGTTTGGVNSLTAPAKLALGAVQTGINFLNGDMGEVKIYATAMTDTDRSLEEGNLIHKWGISLPAAPTGLTATPFSGQVQLAWNSYPGATNYLVKRSTVSGGPYTVIGSSTKTNYLDATVVNGTTYYYVVSAVTAYTNSSNSSPASATPVPPAVITWFKADAITGLGNGAAVASWSDSSGNGFNATQVTSSQRPTYLLNAMNGMPAVHFNSAASDSLGFNRSVQDDFTIMCVFRSTQGLNSGTYYYQGAGLVNAEVSGPTADFGTCLFASGQISAGTGSPDVSANSGNGYNDGNPHLMTFKRIKNSGEVDLYVDGSLAGAVTGSTNSLNAPSRIVLGAQQTGINFLTGDIAEVKVFPNALADTSRGIEENSLECKYGISGGAVTPATPVGLTGVWGNRSASLNWLGVSGAAGYNVYFSTNAGGPFSPLVAGIKTNSYVHTQAVTGVTNYYEVAATYACTVSPLSAPVAVFLPKPVVSIASPDASGISVSWPSWASDWNLYYATNLVPPVSWLLVTNPVVSTNNQLNVTVPIGIGISFFRLISP